MTIGIYSGHMIVTLLFLISLGPLLRAEVQQCLNKVCLLHDGEKVCGPNCRCYTNQENPDHLGGGVCGGEGNEHQLSRSAQSTFVGGKQSAVQLPNGGGAQGNLLATHGAGVQGASQIPHANSMADMSQYPDEYPGESIYGGDLQALPRAPHGTGGQGIIQNTYGVHSQGMPHAGFGGGSLQRLPQSHYGYGMQGTYGGGYGGTSGHLGNTILGGIRTATYGVTSLVQQHQLNKMMRQSMQPPADLHQSMASYPDTYTLPDKPEQPPVPPPRTASLRDKAPRIPLSPTQSGAQPPQHIRPPPPPPRSESLRRPTLGSLPSTPTRGNLPSPPRRPLPPAPKNGRLSSLFKKPTFSFPKLPKLGLAKPKFPPIKLPRFFKKG